MKRVISGQKNQNRLYFDSVEIDNILENMETKENKKNYSNKDAFLSKQHVKKDIIDSLDSLFQLFYKLIKFNLLFQQFLPQANSKLLSNHINNTNHNLVGQRNNDDVDCGKWLKDIFLIRIREEIRKEEFKDESNIFKFLISRSSDNPLILQIGKSIFKEILSDDNSEMLLLFQDIFAYDDYNKSDEKNKLDFEIKGCIYLNENNEQTIGLKAELKTNQFMFLHMKDLMYLVKNLIIFSFIFDLFMNTLFVYSGKVINYDYLLHISCNQNYTDITTLSANISQIQKCFYNIKIFSNTQIQPIFVLD